MPITMLKAAASAHYYQLLASDTPSDLNAAAAAAGYYNGLSNAPFQYGDDQGNDKSRVYFNDGTGTFPYNIGDVFLVYQGGGSGQIVPADYFASAYLMSDDIEPTITMKAGSAPVGLIAAGGLLPVTVTLSGNMLNTNYRASAALVGVNLPAGVKVGSVVPASKSTVTVTVLNTGILGLSVNVASVVVTALQLGNG